MSYSAPPPSPYQTPGPGPAPRRGRPWLLIVAGLTLLVSLLLCGLGGMGAVNGITEITDQAPTTGSSTVALDEGEKRSVWVEDESIACTAQGPTGTTGARPTVEKSVAWGESDLVVALEVTAESAGDYTVVCDGPYRVAGDVPIGSTVVAMIGGSLCCLSVVLGGIGLLLWSRRRA